MSHGIWGKIGCSIFFTVILSLICTSQQSTSQRFRPLETLHVIQSVQEGALLWTPPHYGVLVSSFHTLLNSTSHIPKLLKTIYPAFVICIRCFSGNVLKRKAFSAFVKMTIETQSSVLILIHLYLYSTKSQHFTSSHLKVLYSAKTLQ